MKVEEIKEAYLSVQNVAVDAFVCIMEQTSKLISATINIVRDAEEKWTLRTEQSM